jgi:hypothetical protein
MTRAPRARLRFVVGALAAVTAVLTFASAASAVRSLFFEETAQAFWTVPHQCADGSTVEGTLLVSSTRDFESPDTEDIRSHRAGAVPGRVPGRDVVQLGRADRSATITSTDNLKSVTATGSGIARDNLGGTHQVTFDVTWTAVGPLMTTVNGPGSKRQQREATATGRVTFDGQVLVDGPANHPTRPAPFIRVDTEK